MRTTYFSFLNFGSMLFKFPRWLSSYLVGALLCIGLSANAQITIDGNPADWDSEAAKAQPTYIHVQDPFQDELDDQFTTGAADENFAVKTWTYSQVKNKNNIANGAAVLIGTKLHFAGDRLTTDGDAQIGFWFFQDGTSPLGVGTPGDKGYFEPLPAIGDLLVLANFTNGGRMANVTVYGVESYNYDNKGAVSSWNFIEMTGTDAAAAQNNDNIYNVPDGWGYGSDTYPTNAFYEGYVDLSSLEGGNPEGISLCFGSFLLETRSSASLTASLDDFVGGGFSTIPEIEVADNGECENPEGGAVSVELCASSEDENLSYTWYSDEGLTNEVGNEACITVNISQTTNYWVVATNDIGCNSDATMVTAYVYENPTCEITAFENLSGYLSNDGSIDLTVSGGTAPYVISWSGPDGFNNSSEDISNLAAGIYTVTITDANGCETTCEQEIIWPPTAPTCLITPTHVTCFNENDGSATVEAGEGSGEYTYTWYNDSDPGNSIGTGESIDGLSAGDYTVVVVDVNTGLDSECYTTINEPEEIMLTCPDDVSLEACTTEEEMQQAFDSFLASASATQGENQLEVLNDWDGTYPELCGDEITVRFWVDDECADPNGCEATFTINGPDAVVVTEAVDGEVDACDLSDQAAAQAAFDAWLATASVSGGCDPTSTPDITTAPDYCGGSVMVTWTVEDHCFDTYQYSATFTINASAPIEAYCSNELEVPICASPEEIDVLFAEWKNGFGYSGGCADAMDNKAELEVLNWRDYFDELTGGTVSFTYTVWDNCNSDEITCEFVVPQCVVNCETAFGMLDGSTCFLDDGFNRWGWTNNIEEGEYSMPLYAGAAQCDPDKGELTGSVEITYSGGTLSVQYLMDEGYSLSEVHVYVGCGKYPVGNNGKETVAPGQFTHNAGSLDRVADYTVEFTDVTGPVWVIAHAVVCDVPGSETASAAEYVEIACSDEEQMNFEANAYGAKGKSGNLRLSELKAYPNPFNDRVSFEFVSAKDANARLEISNALGQRIAILMDHPVKKGVVNRTEFKPVNEVSGIMIYRLILDDEVSTGTLIYRK